jgi:hypothetical protein
MPDTEQFKAVVKGALDEGKLSVREVARRSQGRISTTSVLNMLGGHIPYSDVIVEFAEAVSPGPDRAHRLANDLLALAGKRVRYSPELLASVIHSATRGHAPQGLALLG